MVLYEKTSEEGIYVKYKKNDFTENMEKFVRKINEFYKSNKFVVNANDVELNKNTVDLLESFHDDGRISIEKMDKSIERENFFNKVKFEIKDKNVHRTFCRNSWFKGGRYYAIWNTSLPKSLRRKIYLNDDTEPLSSLDFSSFNARLCYHVKMKRCSKDQYIIEGYDISYRDVFKLIFNIALNSYSFTSSVKNSYKELTEDEELTEKIGIKFSERQIKDFLRSLERQHSEIKDLFYNDKGVEFMNIESRIISKILKDTIEKRNIFILSVHDEILFPDKYKKTIKMLMEYCYKDILESILNNKKLLDRFKPLPFYISPVVK